MNSILVVIVVALPGARGLVSPGACPKLANATSALDLAQFAGRWYLQAYVPNAADDGTLCSMDDFVVTGTNTVLYTNTANKCADHSQRIVQGNGTLGADGRTITVRLSPLLQLKTTIVYTDYKTVALAYACTNYGVAHTSTTWLFTRSTFVSTAIVNVGCAFGVANEQLLRRVSSRPCCCV